MRKLAALAVPMVLAGLMAKSQSNSSNVPMPGSLDRLQLTANRSGFPKPESKSTLDMKSGSVTGSGGDVLNPRSTPELNADRDELGLKPASVSYGFRWPGRDVSAGLGDTIREVSFALATGARIDTVPRINWAYRPEWNQAFPARKFLLPAAMIAYGFAGLKIAGLQSLNHKIREEVWVEEPHRRFHADNYLMYVPALAVYGLNAAGIHGEHNFKDRTMLLLMTQLFAQGTVFSLKSWTHTLRPDGSAYNSFPSGHTAEAFANAEFLRMEYKNVSPWYGIAGYAVATTTGMLRMYNNKHWLNDVVAGAGIGIASTRMAYWLYPKVQHWLFHDKSPGTVLMPSYNNGSVGLTFAKHF